MSDRSTAEDARLYLNGDPQNIGAAFTRAGIGIFRDRHHCSIHGDPFHRWMVPANRYFERNDHSLLRGFLFGLIRCHLVRTEKIHPNAHRHALPIGARPEAEQEGKSG